jgi:hypothetical protein
MKKKKKQKIEWSTKLTVLVSCFVLVFAGVIGTVRAVGANGFDLKEVTELAKVVTNDNVSFLSQLLGLAEQSFGIAEGSHSTNFTAENIEATTGFVGDITGDVTGDLIGGTANFLEGVTELSLTSTVTTTLTAAMSGETFYFSGVSSTAFVLPATSTSAGVFYKFVVDGALSTDCTVQTAGGANLMEGSLLVAGAVVDCDGEDTVTFVADGENIGDFFEIRSDGDYWMFGASGALSSSKMTCTTST